MEIFELDRGKITTRKIFSKDTRKKQWIDIVTEDKDFIRSLMNFFHIHALTLEDCFVKTRSKIEPHTHYAFIVSKYIKENYQRVQNNFILYGNTLITIRKEEVPYIKNLKKNTKFLEKLMDKGMDFLLHELLDRQIDLIFPLINKIENKAVTHENTAHTANDILLIERLFKLKNNLTIIQKTIRPLIEITAILKESTNQFTSKGSKLFFRDIHDHTVLISNELDHTRETILSTINMVLAFNSDKMNQNMKILTIVTTILMPLTLITGIYGMNFRYMPEVYMKYGYPITLFVMIILGAVMLFFFKKYKWI